MIAIAEDFKPDLPSPRVQNTIWSKSNFPLVVWLLNKYLIDWVIPWPRQILWPQKRMTICQMKTVSIPNPLATITEGQSSSCKCLSKVDTGTELNTVYKPWEDFLDKVFEYTFENWGGLFILWQAFFEPFISHFL